MKFIAALALAISPLTAAAQETPDIVRLTVLPGWDAGDGTRMAGLRFDLAPGWKTYWRAPGDAGIPPRFDFAGENISGVTPGWPTPEVFDQNGMRSIGYANSVVIPLSLSTPDITAPTTLRGEVQIGVCEEICVPVTLAFDAVLPADGPRDGSIVAAILDRPQTAAEAGLGQSFCTVAATDRGLQLDLSIPAPAGGLPEVVVETGDKAVWVSEPRTALKGDRIDVSVDMIHMDGGSFALDRSAVRITLLGEGGAVDLRGCTSP